MSGDDGDGNGDLASAISAALYDHLAGDNGGMVTGFHVIAEFIDSDGESRMLYEWAPGQRLTTTMGLLEWARGVAAYEQRRFLDDVSGGG